MSSSDGKVWTFSAGGKPNFGMVAFGGGVFVAVGDSVARSTDGINWQIASDVSGKYVAYGNGKFLIPGGFAEFAHTMPMWTSPDGLMWTQVNAQMPAAPNDDSGNGAIFPRGAAFGNGVFGLAIGTSGPQPLSGSRLYHMKSVDGVNWEWAIPGGRNAGGINGTYTGNSLFFEAGQFVQLTPVADVQCRTSADLMTWTNVTVPGANGFLEAISYASSGTSAVIVGAGYLGSGPDLQNLVGSYTTSNFDGQQFGDIAANGATVVVTTSTQRIRRSANGGATFPQIFSSPGASFVSFANGQFVGIGKAGLIVRSATGDSWSQRLSNTTSDLLGIGYGAQTWVAVGANGTIVTSPDASFFNLQNSGTQIAINAVTYGAAGFVAVGSTGAVLNSPDGTHWTVRGTDDAITLRGVAYGNGKYVAVGDAGAAEVSTDGLSWKGAGSTGVSGFTSIGFARNCFVGVTVNFSAYVTTNGTNWTALDLRGQPVYRAQTSDGEIWLAGGQTVWKSRAADFLLAADSISAGHFRLGFQVPLQGSYRVQSSSAANGPWVDRDLISVDFRSDWIDPEGASGSRFYRVRHE
jgi:hypothetical protein